MSGTKKSIDIESIRKIFKARGWLGEFWPTTNLAYDKGTKVFWFPKNSKVRVIITQVFDKNWTLFEACQDPRYHPRRVWPIPMLGLFPVEEWVQPTNTNARLLIKRVYDHWLLCEELFPQLSIPVDPNIKKELTKILHKLN